MLSVLLVDFVNATLSSVFHERSGAEEVPVLVLVLVVLMLSELSFFVKGRNSDALTHEEFQWTAPPLRSIRSKVA